MSEELNWTFIVTDCMLNDTIHLPWYFKINKPGKYLLTVRRLEDE